MTNCRKVIILLSLVLIACTREIEVPEGSAGVVYRDRKKIDDVVLKAGVHEIGLFSDVAFFDIREQESTIQFDILFKDATSADIDLSVTWIPLVDTLSKICDPSQPLTQYNSIDWIVESEIRSQVRYLLMETDRATAENEVFNMIENHLRTEAPVAGIIEIKTFTPGKLVSKR